MRETGIEKAPAEAGAGWSRMVAIAVSAEGS
jgi:hypothetical protein